jgi:acetyltransferase-like isoleucine patch superfamily enzyme
MKDRADVSIGPGAEVDESAMLGYPASRPTSGRPLIIGAGARIRSGTILYGGSVAGDNLQTGHNVVIREDSYLGHDVSVWSNSIIDYGCVVGDRVKIHSNCYVAQFTELEDDVFLAPGVTIANDLYPGNRDSADAMAGPLIRAGAQIGVNSTILPFVTIGEGAIIGAGSVVTRNIPAGVVAHGNPARVTRKVSELGDIASIVREQRGRRFRSPLSRATNGNGGR